MTEVTLPKPERPRPGFLAGVLTTLAVLAGGSVLLILTCRSRFDAARDAELQQVVFSPDSSVKAVQYVRMGGGAAGWCYQRIALRPRTESGVDIGALEKEGEYVFSSSCSSNLELSWLSSTHLHITYTMDEAGVSVYQRASSPDGKVRLTYEVTSK
jgi:hypothetical protein